MGHNLPVFEAQLIQIFPNHNYAKKVINEMKRLAKKGIILLCNRKSNTVSCKEHLYYNEELYGGWDEK